QILTVTRRLVDQSPPENLIIKNRRMIPTRLQIISMRIANAQVWAKQGIYLGWERLAKLYSHYVEQMGTFYIRLALLGRFVGLLASPKWRRVGKKASQIKRFGSMGSGPAILPRAYIRIARKLATLGFGSQALQFIQ